MPAHTHSAPQSGSRPGARPERSRPAARAARLGRRVTLVAAALGVVGLSAFPASAHVRVNAIAATQGGFSELAFRVPTESDTASTTKLAITFPTDTPLAFVSVKPHVGWTYKVTRAQLDTPIEAFGSSVTEVVSQITWTADSAATAIKPGEYDDFAVSAGPLPEADSISFKAIQTYSDDSVVRWIEPTPEGGEEPEHPAPTLPLLPAEDAEGASATESASPSADASTGTGTASVNVTPVAAEDDGNSSTLPVVISIVALLAALGAGGLALAGRRRTGA